MDGFKLLGTFPDDTELMVLALSGFSFLRYNT